MRGEGLAGLPFYGNHRAGAATLPSTMGGADDLRDILEGTTIAVLRQIEGLGYAVVVRFDGRQVTAIHSESGERVACTDEDPYLAACEVAHLAGVELDDG